MRQMRRIEKVAKILDRTDFEKITKSEWFCPQCKCRLWWPTFFNKYEDMDGGTDVCINCGGVFQIRKR